MNLQHFTMSKDPANREKTEDRFVVIPGCCYAVIDGVSDKTGQRFGGKTGGQIAAGIVEDAIETLPALPCSGTIEASQLITLINVEFARVAQSLNTEMLGAAQLALVIESPDSFRFIIIGDTGLRINGTEEFTATHAIDDICAYARRVIWHHLEALAIPLEIRNDIARAYTVNGLESVLEIGSPWIDRRILHSLLRRIQSDLAAQMPGFSEPLIEQTLRGGLLIQSGYINKVHALGFPAVNGTTIPKELIVQFDRNRTAINTIELFSDGYFSRPMGTTVQAWEQRFREVEHIDPNKIGLFSSTKGSNGQVFSDDRTIVVLDFGNSSSPSAESSQDSQ